MLSREKRKKRRKEKSLVLLKENINTNLSRIYTSTKYFIKLFITVKSMCILFDSMQIIKRIASMICLVDIIFM